MIRIRLHHMGTLSRLFLCFVLCVLISYIDPFPPSSILQQQHSMMGDDNENDDGILDKYYSYSGSKCAIKGLEKIKQMAIVYTWVNGSIPCYQSLRRQYGGQKSVGSSRDREIGELLYSFRSLEKYLPWHQGPIYLVTPGHIPNWIKLNSPRIHIINQDDLFPPHARQFLPTFNTHVLEQFLYRIPGLTDYFLQVNDDYIFTNPVDPSDFFTCSGGIKILQEKGTISHTPPIKKKGIWISSVLNTQQEMDSVWGQQERKFLKHAPFVYSRRAFERLHQIFDRPLYATLKHKFRSKKDMNNPLLHYYYLLHQGSRELGIPVECPPAEDMASFKLLLMKNNNVEKVQAEFDSVLKGQHRYKVLTLNDEYSDMRVAKRAQHFLQTFLPEPSSFELDPALPRNPLSIRDATTCVIDPTILPPSPPTLEMDAQVGSAPPLVVRYREIRHVSFLNAVLRGLGFGLGLFLAFSVLHSIFQTADPCCGWRNSSTHDKV